MRRTIFGLLMLMMPLFTGCTLPDLLFAALGDHYTASGPTSGAKADHYDRQIDKWKNYEKYGSDSAGTQHVAPWDENY